MKKLTLVVWFALLANNTLLAGEFSTINRSDSVFCQSWQKNAEEWAFVLNAYKAGVSAQRLNDMRRAVSYLFDTQLDKLEKAFRESYYGGYMWYAPQLLRNKKSAVTSKALRIWVEKYPTHSLEYLRNQGVILMVPVLKKETISWRQSLDGDAYYPLSILYKRGIKYFNSHGRETGELIPKGVVYYIYDVNVDRATENKFSLFDRERAEEYVNKNQGCFLTLEEGMAVWFAVGKKRTRMMCFGTVQGETGVPFMIPEGYSDRGKKGMSWFTPHCQSRGECE